MSTSRKVGAFLCLLGFLAVCVLALSLSTPRPFAGLPGIQQGLADDALDLVGDDLAINAPNTSISAEGRNLTVELPDVVSASFDRDALRAQLSNLDGVRSVEINGDPAVVVPPDDAPAPVATAVPEPAATADPEPAATAVPEPAVTADPEPAATAEPEPAATADAEPQPSDVTLSDVVSAFNATSVDFEAGTATLTAADQALLDAVALELAGLSGGPVEVQAHTDNIGDPDVNLLLSQDRAEAVVTYLTSRGVDNSLLSARGFGASQPIADNSTEQGRIDNQRVVFVVEGN